VARIEARASPSLVEWPIAACSTRDGRDSPGSSRRRGRPRHGRRPRQGLVGVRRVDRRSGGGGPRKRAAVWESPGRAARWLGPASAGGWECFRRCRRRATCCSTIHDATDSANANRSGIGGPSRRRRRVRRHLGSARRRRDRSAPAVESALWKSSGRGQEWDWTLRAGAGSAGQPAWGAQLYLLLRLLLAFLAPVIFAALTRLRRSCGPASGRFAHS